MRACGSVLLGLALGIGGCTGVNPAFGQVATSDTGTDSGGDDPPPLEPDAQAQECSTQWWDDGWAHRARLVLRNDDLIRPLDDFPALVTLTADRLDFATAADDGRDVRFVDPDCTVLDHEWVAWADAQASAWVRIPQLQPQGRPDFVWMYWGNPNAQSNQDPGEVWEDYEAVWHFEGTDDDATIVDTGPRGLHGVATGTRLDAGAVANARRFAPTEPSLIEIPQSESLLGGWAEFAVSHWIYLDYPDDASWLAADPHAVLSKRGGSVYGRTWRESWLEPGTGHFQTDFRFEEAGGQHQRFVLTRQRWHHVVYQYDGSRYELFLDGRSYHRHPLASDELISDPQIMRMGDEADAFDGLIDELTIEHRSHAPAWFAMQYASMNDALWTYEAVESRP